ncbi:unnamed protein product [Amoebophrya sp. A120]|nr:unnamed protein product [Amoebophrya sp. A120]|eukprot:GSA120T00002786001.1
MIVRLLFCFHWFASSRGAGEYDDWTVDTATREETDVSYPGGSFRRAAQQPQQDHAEENISREHDQSDLLLDITSSRGGFSSSQNLHDDRLSSSMPSLLSIGGASTSSSPNKRHQHSQLKQRRTANPALAASTPNLQELQQRSSPTARELNLHQRSALTSSHDKLSKSTGSLKTWVQQTFGSSNQLAVVHDSDNEQSDDEDVDASHYWRVEEDVDGSIGLGKGGGPHPSRPGTTPALTTMTSRQKGGMSAWLRSSKENLSTGSGITTSEEKRDKLSDSRRALLFHDSVAPPEIEKPEERSISKATSVLSLERDFSEAQKNRKPCRKRPGALTFGAVSTLALIFGCHLFTRGENNQQDTGYSGHVGMHRIPRPTLEDRLHAWRHRAATPNSSWSKLTYPEGVEERRERDDSVARQDVASLDATASPFSNEDRTEQTNGHVGSSPRENNPRFLDRRKNTVLPAASELPDLDPEIVNSAKLLKEDGRQFPTKLEDRANFKCKGPETLKTNPKGNPWYDKLDQTCTDWTRAGLNVISAVQHQGFWSSTVTCGTCWAYATSAQIEAQLALSSKDGTLRRVDLGEVISCTSREERMDRNKFNGIPIEAVAAKDLPVERLCTDGNIQTWVYAYMVQNGIRLLTSEPQLQWPGEPPRDVVYPSDTYDDRQQDVPFRYRDPTKHPPVGARPDGDRRDYCQHKRTFILEKSAASDADSKNFSSVDGALDAAAGVAAEPPRVVNLRGREQALQEVTEESFSRASGDDLPPVVEEVVRIRPPKGHRHAYDDVYMKNVLQKVQDPNQAFGGVMKGEDKVNTPWNEEIEPDNKAWLIGKSEPADVVSPSSFEKEIIQADEAVIEQEQPFLKKVSKAKEDLALAEELIQEEEISMASGAARHEQEQHDPGGGGNERTRAKNKVSTLTTGGKSRSLGLQRNMSMSSRSAAASTVEKETSSSSSGETGAPTAVQLISTVPSTTSVVPTTPSAMNMLPVGSYTPPPTFITPTESKELANPLRLTEMIVGKDLLRWHGTELEIRAQLQKMPVVGLVDASGLKKFAWGPRYKKHIISKEDFPSYSLTGTVHLTGDHYVQVVGLKRDENTGTLYWWIKNSWGPKWGDNGYFRMKYGEGLLLHGVTIQEDRMELCQRRQGEADFHCKLALSAEPEEVRDLPEDKPAGAATM